MEALRLKEHLQDMQNGAKFMNRFTELEIIQNPNETQRSLSDAR
jgi:hypothetical protein